MAAYPTLKQLTGTTRETLSGIRVNRAISGKPYFTKFSTQNWYVFKVLHHVDDTDLATLQTHYSTHRMAGFSFVFTPTSEGYTVQYAESPRLQTLEGDGYWLVENTLVSTDRVPFGIVILKQSSIITILSSRKITGTVAVSATSSLVVVKKAGRKSAVALSHTTAVSASIMATRKSSNTVSVSSTITVVEKRSAKAAVTIAATNDISVTGTKA